MSPENYFLDWQKSQTLAETLSPLVGQLYRQQGVETVLCGKTLINATTIDIIKTHRVARRYLGESLPIDKTLPLVQQIATLELAPCRIDIGGLPNNIGNSIKIRTL